MEAPPVLDRAALDRLHEWGGDKLLRQMLRLFLENTPERLTQIESGLAPGGDGDEAHRAAHSLKSSAANVGAMAVSRTAAQLETATREGSPEECRALLVELRDAFRAADAELRRVLQEDAP